ncbi:glycosyltransferase family 2 protein [Microvirga sp. BSC39]|uniref:glycosyltransferase family 2 protein n=1 Tax=Microvirga sp. BSC39 TaxID=1549810 RepID=UPI0004E89547|nr:glycosyltransferase family 2 protein [Microvirga sp. BSC39]KFG70308.1 hypothetical protein JH26_05275 [Microvirga sp. BSC39]
MTPRVSVIIPAYNAAPYIRRALLSACDQTVRDIEVIVIDDGSSDATGEIVLEVASTDSRIKYYVRESNGGPSAARNDGMRMASGEWIALLDADDEMLVDRLERLLELSSTTSADIVADNILITPANAHKSAHAALPSGAPPYYFVVGPPEYVRRNMMLTPGFKLGYLKPMFRRELLLTNDIFYDTSVLIGEDYLLCLRALIAGARFVVTSEPLYRYYVNAGSLSSKLRKQHLVDFQRAQHRIGTASNEETLRRELTRYDEHLDLLLRYMDLIEAIKHLQVARAARLALAEPRTFVYLLRSSSEAITKRVRRLPAR